MTIELCRFSLQDVFSDWKLLVVLILLLSMMLSLIGSLVYWNILAFRIWKMISRREIDMALAIFDNQKFSHIFGQGCLRCPLIKAVMCLLLAFFFGGITTAYCVIFLTR